MTGWKTNLKQGEIMILPDGSYIKAVGLGVQWIGQPERMGNMYAKKDADGNLVIFKCPEGCLFVPEEEVPL